jgi:RHS repeat-associated protein
LLLFAVPSHTAYRVLSDLLYRSVAFVTTGNVVTEAYDIDAYGNTLCYSGPGTDGQWFTDDDVQTNNPINTTIFTGRQYDPESQIYYYRARYYSPQIGRFISRDPLRNAEQRQGPNIYEYVWDNPVNAVDPTGLQRPGYMPAGNQGPTGPSSPTNIGPTKAGNSEGDGDLGDLGALIASNLSQASYQLAYQKGSNGCGPHTGHPNCNCCIITFVVATFGDNDLYYWNLTSGYLANESCDDAQQQEYLNQTPPEGTEINMQFFPW